MAEDTKETDINEEEVKVLARAMFKAQNQKDDDGNKAAFKDAEKSEYMLPARRTIKAMARLGYKLSKA